MRSRHGAILSIPVLVTVLLVSCSRPKPVIAPEPPEAGTRRQRRPSPPPPPPARPARSTSCPSRRSRPRASRRAGVVSGDLPADVEAINRAGYLTDVFFETDKADLRDETREVLAKNAAWLREHPSVSVLIEGHCDERNTAEYNLALGWRRANAGKDYIVSLGVDADRIATISYGEEKPFASGSDESAWSQNRRAHFVVTGR